MATADLLFEVSTFRYPEYLGGLYQLTEQATISSFVLSFESANNNIKLSRDQLRECWFHALNQEYRKVLSNTASMTQDQIQHADELLSRGIEQANALQWLPITEWEAAEYDPNRRMNDDDQRQISKHQNVPQHQRGQDYDPLLLLQAVPDISLHAKRFYEGGVKKFLNKTKGRCNPAKVEQYKLQCVCQGQDHVKNLLRTTYSAEKKAGAGQFAQGEETADEPQKAWYKWKRDAKWRPVWNQLREERKRIASELGNGPLIEQGLIIDIDSTIRTKPSGMSRLTDVTTRRSKRLRRTIAVEERHESANAGTVSGVQTRSMLRQKQTPPGKDSVTGMEDDFRNLLCEDYPELLQQAQEPSLEEVETMKPTKEQIFARMKRSRRERKNLLRREEMEKRITAEWDKDTNPVSTLSNGEPSTTSTNDPERASSSRKQHFLGKKMHDHRNRRPNRTAFPGAGISLDTSNAFGVKIEDQKVPVVLPSFKSHEGEPEGVIIKAETQDEPQFYEGDEMDVEISGKIAKLKM